MAEFKQLRTEFPQVAQFPYQLALAQIENKELDEAVASLRQALSLDPNLVEATLVLAELDVRRRGNYTAAIQSLNALLGRFPKLERAHALLSDAYRAQGQTDEALTAAQRWKTALSNSPTPPYVIGVLQRQQQKDAEARRSFEDAVKLAPNFLLALEQLTDLDLRERKGEQALARAQELAARHPKSAAPWLLLGRVQLALGALKPAEEALQKAAKLDSKSTTAPMLLAQLYVRTNQRVPALENLGTVLGPEFE